MTLARSPAIFGCCICLACTLITTLRQKKTAGEARTCYPQRDRHVITCNLSFEYVAMSSVQLIELRRSPKHYPSTRVTDAIMMNRCNTLEWKGEDWKLFGLYGLRKCTESCLQSSPGPQGRSDISMNKKIEGSLHFSSSL